MLARQNRLLLTQVQPESFCERLDVRRAISEFQLEQINSLQELLNKRVSELRLKTPLNDTLESVIREVNNSTSLSAMQQLWQTVRRLQYKMQDLESAVYNFSAEQNKRFKYEEQL